MRLRALTLQASHRMARRFGADRCLEIQMPSMVSDLPPSTGCSGDNARRQIIRWLTSRGHQFLGRTWCPIFVERDSKFKKVDTAQGKVSKQYFVERVRFFATHGDEFLPLPKGVALPPEAAAVSQTERYNVRLAQLLQWSIGLNARSNREQPELKLFSRQKLCKCQF